MRRRKGGRLRRRLGVSLVHGKGDKPGIKPGPRPIGERTLGFFRLKPEVVCEIPAGCWRAGLDTRRRPGIQVAPSVLRSVSRNGMKLPREETWTEAEQQPRLGKVQRAAGLPGKADS